MAVLKFLSLSLPLAKNCLLKVTQPILRLVSARSKALPDDQLCTATADIDHQYAAIQMLGYGRRLDR